jgi:hypothetical protein
MALSDLYVPLTSLNEYFVDKDSGLPLAGGTLSFYRDSARSTPKPVYQLVLVGADYQYVALPDPITLSAVGTAMDSGGNNVLIYAYPYLESSSTDELTEDLYYVVCESFAGVEQWIREAIPSIGGGVNPPGSEGDNLNQLSNPQFSKYLLQDAPSILTLTGAQTVFPIAPDWDFVASGTGIVTISRVPVSGNEAIPTYPASYLTITIATGVVSPYLRQRLYYNSGIWSGEYLSGSVVAQVGVGSNSLAMNYNDASGVTSDVNIFSAAIGSTWASYGGSVQIGNSSDTLAGNQAYVDITIDLPTSNTISITSIQVQVNSQETLGGLVYDQRSSNRELALMGDYYIPRLEYKTSASLVVGWDFPKNPMQLGSSGSVTSSTAEYIWDQTILQTTGLTVDYAVNAITGGLTLNHDTANQSYALIQYLDGAEATKFLGTTLSVNVNGYTMAGGNQAAATGVQVQIFANPAADKFGTLPTSLVQVSSAGAITLTGTATTNGWYAINRHNLPPAQGQLNILNPTSNLSYQNDLGFNGWNIDNSTLVSAGVQGIAVVVSFAGAASTTDYLTCIDSISVVPGDIPCRTDNMTIEQTLQDCQEFYETSFEQGTVIPTATTTGIYCETMMAANAGGAFTTLMAASTFILKWLVFKRAVPVLTLYSGTSVTVDKVQAILIGNNTQTVEVDVATSWNTPDINQKRARFTAKSPTVNIESGANDGTHGTSSVIQYHYVADARIGI